MSSARGSVRQRDTLWRRAPIGRRRWDAASRATVAARSPPPSGGSSPAGATASPSDALREAPRIECRARRADSLQPMTLLHTCYRITDIERSVAFYRALGFEEIRRMPIREEAINVFMNQPGDGDEPKLELTYNIGVDHYELGTAYGHIAITSNDLDATLAGLAAQGIEPERPPYTIREGGNRICFVRDPDGYRVELVERP
jgi:lactoylglutathione lyase